MRQFCSIVIALLQCVSISAGAATGHTTNNGGNLAEIRYTDLWNRLPQILAPCFTPQNLCKLDWAQKLATQKALQMHQGAQFKLPAEGDLHQADGQPKSEIEMLEAVLLQLHTCAGFLSAVSMAQVAREALAITEFESVKLFRGQTWYVYQRNGLWVEHVRGQRDFTREFRELLRVKASSMITFDRLRVRQNGGLIEISGRVKFQKPTETDAAFHLTINPYEDGTIPPVTELSVFK